MEYGLKLFEIFLTQCIKYQEHSVMRCFEINVTLIHILKPIGNIKDDRAFSLLHQELPQILVLCFP